jgi:hypothetical protein
MTAKKNAPWWVTGYVTSSKEGRLFRFRSLGVGKRAMVVNA